LALPGVELLSKTVREKLPRKRFQRSEFLLDKGALDMIIKRDEIRDRLYISYLCSPIRLLIK